MSKYTNKFKSPHTSVYEYKLNEQIICRPNQDFWLRRFIIRTNVSIGPLQWLKIIKNYKFKFSLKVEHIGRHHIFEKWMIKEFLNVKRPSPRPRPLFLPVPSSNSHVFSCSCAFVRNFHVEKKWSENSKVSLT